MAEIVIRNVKILADDVDVSGDHNQVNVNVTAELLDKTTFGSSGRKRVSGLTDIEIAGQGFTNVAKSDPEYGPGVGSSGVVSIGTSGGAVGEVAFMCQSMEGSYAPFNSGTVGEVLPFDVQFQAAGQPLVRGKSLINTTSLEAAAAGTAVNIGAVSTGQFLYGSLHITSVGSSGGGSGIRVAIQTDSSSGFGSPTTQIAFTSSTGTYAEWGTRVAGAITDTWARVNVTVTSSSRAYSIFSAVGVK